MDNPQCKIHAEEIKGLRERTHKHGNEITKLMLMHEQNQRNIEEIKNSLEENTKEHKTLAEHVTSARNDIDWIKKTQWFVVTTSVVTLIKLAAEFILQR